MQEYLVVVSLINGDKIEFQVKGEEPIDVRKSLTNTVHGSWKFAKIGEKYVWFDSNHIVSISVEIFNNF